MLDRGNHTAARLLDGCEAVLCAVENVEDATTRRIAERAQVNASAVVYHFGSREALIIAVAERVYHRLNAERLVLLDRAVTRRAPEPPDLEEVIAAVVGPSVRWSLDPHSSYRVLSHFTALAQMSRDPGPYRGMVEDIDHHRAFVPHLRRIAPWLDDVDIGWRLSCALGIRSQAIRHRARTEVMTDSQIDLHDADVVVARMVEVIAPMFRRCN